MKRAIFNVYTIFGTSERAVDVLYRGKVLKSYTKADVLDWTMPSDRALLDLAKAWAQGAGFTHYILSVQPK